MNMAVSWCQSIARSSKSLKSLQPDSAARTMSKATGRRARCNEKEGMSACVLKALRDAVDAREQRLEQLRVLATAFAPA